MHIQQNDQWVVMYDTISCGQFNYLSYGIGRDCTNHRTAKPGIQKNKKLEADYGPVLDYLGMQVNLSNHGIVKFTMFPYLEDILVECK